MIELLRRSRLRAGSGRRAPGRLPSSGCGILMATCAAVAHVGGAEDGWPCRCGRPGFRCGSDRAGRRDSVTGVMTAEAVPSAQFVRPSAIHAHAFHAANADELDAYIITAIPLVGKVDQGCAGGVRGFAAASASPIWRRFRQLRSGPCRPSRAQQQHVAGHATGARGSRR